MRKCWILSITVFLSLTCSAQETLRFKFDHFIPKSGLSSIYVRKIEQDPLGFMWVGTEDGLNRYNGNEFSIYSKDISGNHKITGSDIRDLIVDTASTSIWCVNSFGGIDQINYITGNVIYSYIQNLNPLTRGLLFSSLCLLNGNLYIGSSMGIFVLSVKTKKISRLELAMPSRPNLSTAKVNCLFAHNKSKIGIYYEGFGAALLDPQTGRIISSNISNKATDIVYYGICEPDNKTIFAATNKGLIKIIEQENKELAVLPLYFSGPGLNYQSDVYACRSDKAGNIWFSQPGNLIKINPSNGQYTIIKENVTRQESDWVGSSYSIFFDSNENLWLGCQQGLAYAQTHAAPFFRLTNSSGSEIKIGHAYYLQPLNDSILYSCAQDGLYKVNLNSGDIFAIQNKKPFYHIFKQDNNDLLVANLEGSFILKNNKLIPFSEKNPVFKSFGKIIINSHCQIGDSMLVFGTENNRGIFVWNIKKGTVKNINSESPKEPLKENVVNGLYKDSHNRVWIMGDRSISIFDPIRKKTSWVLPANASTNDYFSIFFDVCEIKNNYYVASYGSGVVVLDSNLNFKKLISSSEGLSSNSVYKILPWQDSLLFVTSNHGISRVNLNQNATISCYYESDGLHGDIFEENSGASNNRSLFAGGKDGITMINPEMLTDYKKEANLYIDKIKIETSSGLIDTTNLLIKQLDIPTTSLQTTVYFSFTDYGNIERNRFAYRIKEISGDWVQLGHQHSISFIGLSPGKYSLELMALGKRAGSGAGTKSLLLKVLPKWYETVLFKIALLICIIGFFYLLYSYRLNQIKKQQMIRKQIASDLHDDIGSTLNAVKVYTHLAQKQPANKAFLELIETSLTDVSLSLRDIIWVLDQSADNLFQLMERIKKFAIPLLQAKEIEYTFLLDTDHGNRVISKTEKRNLLLISKEVINNLIKHAGSKQMQFTIGVNSGDTFITINDDGKGFDVTTIYEGNGMKNIVYRAAQINYKVSINSGENKGTKIEIRKA